MARQRIFSGSSFEDVAGYARAVVDGDWVFVSGTTGFDYAAGTIEDDAGVQTRQAFANIDTALTEAGASFDDVVRIRVYVADRDDAEQILAAVGERCRGVRPANTTVVTPLLDPRMKVEIEVTALRRR